MARKVGLAFGGGGLRGMAHIGVLQVLAEAGLQVDLFAGTSSGSLIAALGAMDWPAARMEQVSCSLSREQLYDPAVRWLDLVRLGMQLSASFYGLRWRSKTQPPSGLLRGDKLEGLVHSWTAGSSFSALPHPLAVIATDLRSATPVVFAPPDFDDGIGENIQGAAVLTGATIAEACRASTAIPGVFRPKALGGRLLVDGGISDNVPARVLRAMGADVVVAVDLGLPNRSNSLAMWDVLAASMELMTDVRTRSELSHYADYVIRPRVPDLGLTEVERIAESIQAGRDAARAALDELLPLWANPVAYSADPAAGSAADSATAAALAADLAAAEAATAN